MPVSDRDIDHILTHTKYLWHKVSGKKIFITGGTGFFGKWLLESFAGANEKLKLNSEMLVLTRNPEGFKTSHPEIAQNSCIHFLKGDVRDFDFPEGNFDYIIHAATESNSHMNRENPLLILDTIVQGTRHTLDFAVKCNAKRFLLTSSGAVYGKQPAELSHIPENYIGSPDCSHANSPYGEAKRMAELLCFIYQNQHELEAVIARCFAFVGPYLDLDVHYAIGNFIRDGLHSQTINISGDGTPIRSYLYAADMAIWLWTILFNGKPGQAYNVGSDECINIEQLANRVAACFDKPIDIKIAQKKNTAVLPARYVPNIDKARKDMSLDVWTDIDDAIGKTIKFYQHEK